MKYMFLLALAALVLFLWQSKRRADRSRPTTPPKPNKPAPAPTTDMVACAVCQVHLPRTEALLAGPATYCSEAHRRQAEDA